jgi:hypothetical protein
MEAIIEAEMAAIISMWKGGEECGGQGVLYKLGLWGEVREAAPVKKSAVHSSSMEENMRWMRGLRGLRSGCRDPGGLSRTENVIEELGRYSAQLVQEDGGSLCNEGGNVCSKELQVSKDEVATTELVGSVSMGRVWRSL